MLSHEIGIGKSESRMTLAQSYQTAVIVEHLRVSLQIVPVEVVDAVRRLETVVYPFLVAQHFFTAKNERHTLRGEHRSLSQEVQTDKLIFRYSRYARFQSVGETQVIVAAHVAYHLSGGVCPCLLAVVHTRHVNLRMTDCSHDAKLEALLHIRHSGKESTLMVVAERTAQCVPHIVAESTDAVQLTCVRLHRQFVGRVGTAAGAPSLTIYIYAWVYLVYGSTDIVHRHDVVYTHEVESETVDMVFVHPIFHALQHILPHQRLFRCRLVAAARTVGILTVSRLAIVVVWIDALEVAVLDVERVVVYHVEYHSDASPV